MFCPFLSFVLWCYKQAALELNIAIAWDLPKDIHLLKSLASTTRYGTAGRGGVIVVTTKSGSFNAAESNRNKIANKYTNKDFYANDA